MCIVDLAHHIETDDYDNTDIHTVTFRMRVTVRYFVTASLYGVIIIIINSGPTLAASKRGRTKQHKAAPMQSHCLPFPLARLAY